MNNLLKFLALPVALSSAVAFADYSPRWTTPGKVEGIYIDLRDSQKGVLFRFSQPRDETSSSKDDCNNDGNYYSLDTDGAFAKEAYSLLLTLKAKKEKFRFYMEGCSATGFPKAVIIEDINI